MKIVRATIIAAMLVLMPVYAFAAGLGYMRISLIEGDVQLNTPEAGEYGLASINAPLAEGDEIWVPQGGRAELQLNTGTFIRLDQGTAFRILSMDRDSSQFYLSQGYAYIFYDAPEGDVIQIDTPDASTRAFNRAIFRIDMSDQFTDVSVYKGSVETENQVGRTRIDAGQMLSLGQYTDGEVAPMGPPDEWEAWNKTRNDRIFARRDTGSRYLPPELRAYSADFESSGRWVETPDYGYVWTPTIVVGSDWAPYRNGRWIWRDGDYVWVSSDPWGWAPYHYGRWAFVERVGWCWVPPAAGDVYWGPGYVGWVRTGDYVAWVPLAPGEVYYGHGNYGRHSVNTIKININQVRITNVYKNSYINNGATVVSRNTFATASPRIVNVNQNIIRQKIFIKNNFSVGTPAIKPTKSSYFASTRTVPAAKLPPKAVRDIKTKELKQSRPLIRESAKSVFNPGVKPKPLPLNTVTTSRTPGKGNPMIKQFQPEERGKHIAPEITPPPKAERSQGKPAEKGKTFTPESTPDLRGGKPQFKPEDKMKHAVPESTPAPKVERFQGKPEDKMKHVVPESTPTPRGERLQGKPVEKGKTFTPESTPDLRGGKPQFKPEDRMKHAIPESTPPPKVERFQGKPVDKGKTFTPESTPDLRGGKPQFKPEDKMKHAVPESTPPPKGERLQGKPMDKGKPFIPENVPAPKKEEKAKEKIEERGKHITPEGTPIPRPQ